MMNKPDGRKVRRTYINVTLIFLVLALGLQGLVWLYWEKILEPRLRSGALAQANVLAHSQAVKIANALVSKAGSQRLQVLGETLDEVLIFSDPDNNAPLFMGVDLEIDYDVLTAPAGSLDATFGKGHCLNCFVAEVALYSPDSYELVGIARFRVSDSLFQRLSQDIHTTLFTQSRLAILLLIVVWGVVLALIRAINRSRQQAEASARAKSAFLANMSHELRTPLNAIIGFSDLMRRDHKLAPKYAENLSIISRSGEYLLELINDILELSKIEATGVETFTETSFDLYDTLNKVTEMIRLRARKKDLQLVFEPSDNVPRYIKTDERKLRQILLNLLGNAVKFTEEGGVTLRVRLNDGKRDRKAEMLRINFEVEDSGPGIAPEERADLFEAFTQTRSGYAKKEGTGLGLAISRQFIRSLGGDITIRGAAGGGAVFTFTVLVKRARGSETRPALSTRQVIGIDSPEPGARQQRYRILVVDDYEENRTLLRLLLEQVGFEVEVARNGKEAVEISSSWLPHLIWMDMRMPVMDGYAATRNIRRIFKDNPAKHPVVIALTASVFKEDQAAVLAAGCDDFVRRPFRQSEIFSKIREYLGVAYIYAGEEAADRFESDRGELPAEAIHTGIAGLPRNLITELKTALELSDMEHMDHIIADISPFDKDLAAYLKGQIDIFQYDQILTLIETADTSQALQPGGPQ